MYVGGGGCHRKKSRINPGFCLRPRENIEGIWTVGRTAERRESLKLEEVRKHLHGGFREKIEYTCLEQEEKAELK